MVSHYWQCSVQRGRHTKLCIISSLKWIIHIFAQNVTVWFLKLLSTHPIHIVVWGNFSFPVVALSYSYAIVKMTPVLHVNPSRIKRART